MKRKLYLYFMIYYLRIASFFLGMILMGSLRSQNLTNSDVYSFNVGDVMQIRKTYSVSVGWMCYDSLSTLTVQSKSISIGLDSITYKMHVETFVKICNTPTSPTTQPYSYGYVNTTYTVSYTNLSQPAQHMLFYPSCTSNTLAVSDSLKAEKCNNIYWTRYYNNCGGIYTPGDKSYFIKNLGGPYYLHSELDIPDYLKRDLVYYKRATDSCGTFVVGYNPGVGIKEIKPYDQASINLYPNPTCGKVYITAEVEIKYYEIFDMLGNNIKSGKVAAESLEFTEIPKGIYNIRLYSAPGYVITKKIVVAD